ncbi:hypothetical protein [Sphingobium baderi]|uniref:Uncharacterized protein n=1 Tax=Sphingobium baderi LL03 TaxID=1114964 RepID=T0I000_9SPHN|nr:hypothetical protein [Sphingobium baderi]EQB03089.1 hypothetical protein L485_07050 [Sphingobium baderi LL03]KMS60550.1 hypothetical protein V475_19055 [Sphingobium baderi LL03]
MYHRDRNIDRTTLEFPGREGQGNCFNADDFAELVNTLTQLVQTLRQFVERAGALDRSLEALKLPAPSVSVENIRQFLQIDSPGPARFVQILMEMQGQAVSERKMTQLMGCKAASIKMLADKARAGLRECGFEISIARGGGSGYFMDKLEAWHMTRLCKVVEIYGAQSPRCPPDHRERKTT